METVTTLYTEQQIVTYGKHDYISYFIDLHKCWEPNITNLVDTIIQNSNDVENIILDIGCNIGYYSLISARFPNITKVYSIDGNVNNLQLLSKSIILNNIKIIEPTHLCIAEKSGESYTPINMDKINNNIGAIKFGINELEHSEPEITVNTITIDDFIFTNNLKNILIMKMDIEGGELNGLKGATKSLKTNRIKHIIIEITPAFNKDSIEILQILQNNNYYLYNIPQQEIGSYNRNPKFINTVMYSKITNIENFIQYIHIQTNILAIKY